MKDRFIERPDNDLEYESIQVGFLTMEDYIHGWCEYFAQALHEEFGYPIVKMRDSFEEENGTYGKHGAIHMFCMNGNNFIDVRGTTSNFTKFFEPYEDEGTEEEMIISDYEAAPWIRNPDENGIERIENARKYIHKNIERYQPSFSKECAQSYDGWKIACCDDREIVYDSLKVKDLRVCIMASGEFLASVHARPIAYGNAYNSNAKDFLLDYKSFYSLYKGDAEGFLQKSEELAREYIKAEKRQQQEVNIT